MVAVMVALSKCDLLLLYDDCGALTLQPGVGSSVCWSLVV